MQLSCPGDEGVGHDALADLTHFSFAICLLSVCQNTKHRQHVFFPTLLSNIPKMLPSLNIVRVVVLDRKKGHGLLNHRLVCSLIWAHILWEWHYDWYQRRTVSLLHVCEHWSDSGVISLLQRLTIFQVSRVLSRCDHTALLTSPLRSFAHSYIFTPKFISSSFLCFALFWSLGIIAFCRLFYFFIFFEVPSLSSSFIYLFENCSFKSLAMHAVLYLK